MRQSGLNEKLGDEAYGSGIVSIFAKIALSQRQCNAIEPYSLVLVKDGAA
jgi:hypothetical protein